MNASIFHQHLQTQTCNLATNWVKARQHHHTRCIVYQNIDTSGTLQRLDIATLLTNDATLHLVISQLHCRHGTLSRYFATHSLHGGEQNSLSSLFSIVHGLVLQFCNQFGEVVTNVTLSHLHQFFGCIFLFQASNFFQFFLLTSTNLPNLIFQIIDLIFVRPQFF